MILKVTKLNAQHFLVCRYSNISKSRGDGARVSEREWCALRGRERGGGAAGAAAGAGARERARHANRAQAGTSGPPGARGQGVQ